MVAQRLAQRLMQEVGRRVMPAVGGTADVIDLELERVAGPERAFLEDALVDDEIADALLRVGDTEQRALGGADHAMIAGLSARFAIERCLVEDERALGPLLELGNLPAVGDD